MFFNSVKNTLWKGSFSRHCILMIDEMYLPKSPPYQSGQYIGVEKEEKLCKGIVAFMVAGLKYIPFIGQTIPKVTFNE